MHLRPLISKTFAFKDYLKAYQYIDDNRETTMKDDYQCAGKVVAVISEILRKDKEININKIQRESP